MPCPSVIERNVLADITKIIEKNKMGKLKDNFIRKIVVDGLLATGYDASICESRWDKTPSTPAGKLTISTTKMCWLFLLKSELETINFMLIFIVLTYKSL